MGVSTPMLLFSSMVSLSSQARVPVTPLIAHIAQLGEWDEITQYFRVAVLASDGMPTRLRQISSKFNSQNGRLMFFGVMTSAYSLEADAYSRCRSRSNM